MNLVSIILIGAGGIGSQVLTELARMKHALIALNHPGLNVTLFDDDKVESADLARQLFTTVELGLYKSIALLIASSVFSERTGKRKPRAKIRVIALAE